MSAVTASILVGRRDRSRPGIRPGWLALLHEDRGYAWQLLRLQLSGTDLPSQTLDDPPGVLWQASAETDVVGELAALLHLYVARTPGIVRQAAQMPALRRQRVDLRAVGDRDPERLAGLLALARFGGRDLTLAATILPGSRLREAALMALPEWELDIAHTALTRKRSVAGRGLIVHDLRADAEGSPQEAARAQEQAARQAAGTVEPARSLPAPAAERSPARPVPEPAPERSPVIRWPGLRAPVGRHSGHTPEEPRR